MKDSNFRSQCPVSSWLDLFGDKWSLLIVRDLLRFKECAFKDFSESHEKISSARLAERLKRLEELKVLTKSNHPTNKKVFIYRLTRKGKDLAPVVGEFMLWANKYLADHISDSSKALANQILKDRNQVLKEFNT